LQITQRALKIENQSHLGDTECRGSESFFRLAAMATKQQRIEKKTTTNNRESLPMIFYEFFMDTMYCRV